MSLDKKFDVCVIGGCGRVGLPLAICFAKEGKKVAIVDINQASVKTVNAGTMPFKEDGADEALKKVIESGNLKAFTERDPISESENVIFILGTPVSSHLYPTSLEFFNTIKEHAPLLKKGQLIIFRSTLFPGTTEKIQTLFKEKKIEVDVVFCPERISEGLALKEIYELPQIISGFSPNGLKRARALFSIFTDEIIELSPTEAEFAKLITNVWRYIRFSIANQFFMVANSHGLDFYKIYNAVTHKYPRVNDFPKAGFAAGPCLFKDTMQLAAYTNNNLFIGHAAMLINEGLPNYVADRLKQKIKIENKTIGILGMAFKGESDDPRESLSYKLRNILERDCKEILTTDPYVKDERIIDLETVLKKSDLLILAAPHKVYKDLNFKNKPIIDIWDFYGKGCIL